MFEKLSKLKSVPEDELKYIFYSDSFYYVFSSFVSENYDLISNETPYKYGPSAWMINSITGNFMYYYVYKAQNKDSNFLENLYKDSNSSFLLKFLVESSYYTGAKCLEHLANKRHFDLQNIAVHSCSLDAIKLLTKSQHEKIRMEAYKRLGPIDYLDEMILDKSRHVRSLAASWMPMGYYLPQKALSERSYWSFSKIVEKVALDQIPMLLANKHLIKNQHFAERLQARLNSKI